MQSWSGKRVTIVAALGVGDGLLAAALARAARRAGAVARVWSTPLLGLSSWLPGLEVQALPAPEQRAALLANEDFVYVGNAELAEGAASARTHWVFRKSAVDRAQPFLVATSAALREFCDFPPVGSDSPLCDPQPESRQAMPRRIVLHGDSSAPRKCWGERRLLALAQRLRGRGLEPVVLAAPDRRSHWEAQSRGHYPVLSFADLSDVAQALAASAAAVTMDSGIGHLASAVGLPVVSTFQRRSAARFWAPAWGGRAVVTPLLSMPRALLPLCWRACISPARVERALYGLLEAPLPSSVAQRFV